MSKKNNRMSLGDYMAELSYSLKNHVLDRRRIILPLMLAAAVALTVGAGLFFGIRAAINRDDSVKEPAAEETSAESPAEMELNAYPELNDLIQMYYEAVAEGDIDTIRVISRGISEREITDIQVISQSIDHYETIDVYTKPGSEAEADGSAEKRSYVCYVATEVIFKGYAKPVPGMQTFFAEEADGRLVINFAPADMEYINEVSLQDDVVDLSNKITARYNDMLAEDPSFSAFVEALTSGLYAAAEGRLTEEAAAAAALAEAEEAALPEAGEPSAETEAGTPVDAGTSQETESAPAEEGEQAQAGAADAQTAPQGPALLLESVYLRSEASTESEALTTLYPGFEVQVEESSGEWSKISYQGMSGYVKTEFLYFE